MKKEGMKRATKPIPSKTELALAQARLNELLALVQLYEARGGGSQQ
jgi:hypothetical protein